MSYIKQIGCCFLIDGEEYIYEGVYKEKYTGMECSCCNQPIKRAVHLFNSVNGYDNGNYESRFYGSTCIKRIIQTGYSKGGAKNAV